MKSLLVIGLSLLCFVSKAQIDTNTYEEQPRIYVPPDSLYHYYDSVLNDGREGKGNGSFSTNIKCLQSFLITPHHVKDFEKVLAQWARLSKFYGMSIWVSFEWNDTTKRHDIPDFKVWYSDVLKDRTNDIRIEYGLDNVIKSFEFVIEEDKIDVDRIGNYIKQLKAAGYYNDVRMSRFTSALAGGVHNGFYLRNKTSNICVHLIPTDDNNTTIKVYK